MNFNQELINKALLNIGPKYLKVDWKKKWSEESPTTGYCYLISEILYHYIYSNSQSYCIDLNKYGTHWFVAIGKEIIDLTSNQYDFKIPYRKAKHKSFLQGTIKTERGYISKKANLLYDEIRGINELKA